MKNKTTRFFNIIEMFSFEQEYSKRLKDEFNLSDKTVKSIINSAKVTELYLRIKGVRECRLIGFKNKKELANFIMENSEKFDWTYKSNKNERSFFRKINKYKIESQKSKYLGLISFIHKNFFNTNARKITNEELNFIREIKLKQPQISAVKIREEFISKFHKTEISIGCIRVYVREIELEEFKNNIITGYNTR